MDHLVDQSGADFVEGTVEMLSADIDLVIVFFAAFPDFLGGAPAVGSAGRVGGNGDDWGLDLRIEQMCIELIEKVFEGFDSFVILSSHDVYLQDVVWFILLTLLYYRVSKYLYADIPHNHFHKTSVVIPAPKSW
jgi:hypothetical protein